MNKFMKKIMSKKDGFTLVELIVVIAILAILAGVAVPAYSGYIKKANAAADDQVLEAYNTAIAAALAMEGKDTSVANNYFTYTDADKALTPVDQNDETTAIENDVWDNFVQFYGLTDGATTTGAIALDYYTTLSFTGGELKGSN